MDKGKTWKYFYIEINISSTTVLEHPGNTFLGIFGAPTNTWKTHLSIYFQRILSVCPTHLCFQLAHLAQGTWWDSSCKRRTTFSTRSSWTVRHRDPVVVRWSQPRAGHFFINAQTLWFSWEHGGRKPCFYMFSLPSNIGIYRGVLQIFP